jgi:hypothetical protein
LSSAFLSIAFSVSFTARTAFLDGNRPNNSSRSRDDPQGRIPLLA